MKTNKLIASLLALTAVIAVPHVRAADDPAMKEPVKSVYASYLDIHAALAADTMKGVAEKAEAIAKAVKDDKAKMLPAEVADQAEALARAKELKAARAAFKPLSDSLIKYLADHKVSSSGYIQFYCPMAKADWLQKDKDTSNPYYGKAMAECGVAKKKF
jgi:Cu(I)/Ag(I) efflux system membrane fusion protein